MSVIAIDIGSSRIKALLAGWDGRSIGMRSAGTPTRTTEPGELSYPVDAVHSTVERLIADLMAVNRRERADTIVFSCLGTAMAPLDRDGRPLGPALAPGDSRPLRGPGLAERVAMPASELSRRTGSDPGVASFLAHALWYRSERPRIEERVARFRSLRGYVIGELCGADAEDRSWVSRTMLTDLETDAWSEDILAAAGLRADVLPPISPPTTTFELHRSAVERLGLAPRAVAVLGGMDNGCALVGADGPGRSGVANIVGTYEHMAGAASLSEVRDVAAGADAVIHAHVLPGQYITMTRVPIGESLARVADGVPGGIGALMRDIGDQPRGSAITPGLEAVDAALLAGRPRAEVTQSLIEGGARVSRRFADAWDRIGRPTSPIAVVGGGAAGDAVLRLKAELLGRSLVTLRTEQAAVLGALRVAAMARRGLGVAEACTLFENPIRQTIRPRSMNLSEPRIEGGA